MPKKRLQRISRGNRLNVQKDYIHLVISILLKSSVSPFMGYLKGKLSLRQIQRYQELGEK